MNVYRGIKYQRNPTDGHHSFFSVISLITDLLDTCSYTVKKHFQNDEIPVANDSIIMKRNCHDLCDFKFLPEVTHYSPCIIHLPPIL